MIAFVWKYKRAALAAMLIWLISLGAAHAAPAAQEIIVTDCIDRQVAVPQSVRRIACLYAFAGHVVALLGRADDIVAVSNGLQRDVLLNRMYPAIGSAIVPKAQGAIKIEELLKARPDIVFIPPEIGRNKAELQKLQTFRLPSLVVDFRSIAEQQAAISMIGQAIGSEARAEAYNSYYRQSVERVGVIADLIPAGKRLRIFHATTEATRTPSPRSLSADWISVAGLNNVALSHNKKILADQQRVSLEQLYVWNPDVILVNEPGVTKAIGRDAAWAALNAVKTKRVFQMPVGISRWGHPGSLETPLALLWAAKTLYPDRSTGIDLNRETLFFYKTFFQYEVNDGLLSRIMNGRGMRESKHKKRSGNKKKSLDGEA